MTVIKIRVPDKCKNSFLGGTGELSEAKGECKDSVPQFAFHESTSAVCSCVADLKSVLSLKL